MHFPLPSALIALLQVVIVDVVLAGDNAVVIGIAAAGLPAHQRPRVMVLGIAAAMLLRLVLASFAVQLLQVVGLLLAGGLVLLWVCWTLWRELRSQHGVRDAEQGLAAQEPDAAIEAPRPAYQKTMRQAITQIILADVSTSLDNLLAVAGIGREHRWVLVIGLVLSVAFMGIAAALIARLLNRHRWIAYAGVATILYVAVRMIWDGTLDIARPLLGDSAGGM